MKLSARLQRWHWGKIVIVWAWGGMLVAILLREFLATIAAAEPGWAAFTLFAGVAGLAALTAMTWIWLSGKES